MILDYPAARDEIFGQLNTVLAGVGTLIGETNPAGVYVAYQGVKEDEKRKTDKFWLRISAQTVEEPQTVLRADYGSTQKRRYTSYGLIFVQIFIPTTNIQNYEVGTKIAALIKTAFRGKQTESCMWFKNVRIQELPQETAWFRLNVVSEYQYDEIG